MSSVDVAHLLVSLVAQGLPAARTRFPAQVLEPVEWEQLLAEVTSQRVSGWLVQAISDGVLPCTDGQRADAVRLHLDGLVQVLRLERLLLSVAGILDGAEIPYRVLKGAALARTVYPRPSVRVFGDVDVLIPSEQLDATVRLLEGRGYQRRWPELRPGYDRTFGKSVTMITPDGYEVDLHRTLAPGRFGFTIDLPSLFASEASFELAGVFLPALPAVQRFLHACYHAALGNVPPRLTSLRDVAQTAYTTDVDLEAALAVAQAWRGEAVVARAITLTWEAFGLAPTVLSRWAQHYAPTRGERWALATYLRPDHSYGAKALASLPVIEGWRARMAFLSALVLPQEGAVRQFEQSYRQWWRRGGRALLGTRGGR